MAKATQDSNRPHKADVGSAIPNHDLPPIPGRYHADREELLEFYRRMLMIRRFEERCGQLYGLGLIAGFCHLYIGQEAVAVGLQAALQPGRDSVITGYREHGHMLAYGIDPKIVMAELTGRASGISHGKGGSMHMFSTEHKFFGGNGIVGAQVPLGAGLAFAHKYRNDGGCSAAYFGDGSANQGQVYEAYNMAALWKLPVIFVIENNGYAMGTSIQRANAHTALSERGAGFGIPALVVDGMDVLEVRGAATVAVDWVQAGKGPIILEMKTYRYRGHSMSDPARYRSREEVNDMKENHDPLDNLKKDLFAAGVPEAELVKLDEDIRQQVKEAADFAEKAPLPDDEELYTNILVGKY
ncbi:MAG: pyruvate dehydrogenase (acetyl-transferring) E1 component subunit alpha [Zymomonas mobilis]|uniref:pyruvate dehydrogenase (acetyl-transferring) E1 component subunit alpha n=1 Tax=Zymomonas mobilis TaxID=542 RepID=UPI0039EBA9AE